jgi:PAS domain S-box-containing protein
MDINESLPEKSASTSSSEGGGQLRAIFDGSEESLLKQVSGLNQVIRNLPVPIAMSDLSLKIQFANPAFAQFLGRDLSVIVGKSISELFPPAVATDLERISRLVLCDGGSQERRLALVSGEWPMTVRVTQNSIHDTAGTVIGIQSTFQTCRRSPLTNDVDADFDGELSFQTTPVPSEEMGDGTEYAASPEGGPRLKLNRYALASRVRKIGVWEYWPDEERFFPDDVYCSLIGYQYAEFMSTLNGWFSVIPSDYVKIFKQTLTDLLAGKLDRLEIEHPVIRKGGVLRWLSMSAALVREGDQRKLIGASIDITDRKREEEKNRRLITAVDQVAESIMVVDTGGGIRVVNPAFEKMTGYTAEEALGQNPRLLSSGQMDSDFYRDMWRTIAGGETWQGRLINRRKNGELYHAETTISPVLDASGWIANYVSVARDVTREVELETQMRQFQKMEAVGMLAGGIAHDFNNILYAIRGYTELATQMADDKEKLLEMLAEVGKAERRGAELVGQILAFSRQSERGRKPICVQHIIREVIKLLRGMIPATIEVRASIDSDCDPILADPTQIFQVVMVVCTNSFNAMRVDGGLLGVEVREVVVDEKSVSSGQVQQQRLVKIRVTDNGRSLDPETIVQLFDPEYKPGDDCENADIGLSIVYDIIKNHDGELTVETLPAGGNVVEITFPAEPAAVTGDGIPITDGMITKGKRILVVDDEEALVKMLKIMLEGVGYHVYTWTDSQQALSAFRDKPDKFDLVITDQTMPRMTGGELAKEILAINPEMPIILCTGFSELISNEIAMELGIKKYLKKPITVRDLVAAIESLLVAE